MSNEEEVDLEAVLAQDLVPKSRIKSDDYLSTGSTELNLACSGRPEGGFFKGGIFHLVGDSGSGKTWLSMTCMAEAANNYHFNDYRFVLNCPENGALMDYEYFWGTRLAARIEPPSGDWSDPGHANTLEEFYDGILRRVEKGPVIEILDSMDAITAQADLDKYEEQRTAREKGKEATGSYGTSTARTNSAMLRRVNNAIQKTGSILILISQARQNIGFGSQFNPLTNSGGLSLKFFSQLQMWTSRKETLKRRAKGKDRPVGLKAVVKVKKNRITGKDRMVTVPIYDSYGIDDLGGMIDFLVAEGHWKKANGKIDAKELDLCEKVDDLCAAIEESDHMTEAIRGIVAGVWNSIESELKLPRKRRYE